MGRAATVQANTPSVECGFDLGVRSFKLNPSASLKSMANHFVNDCTVVIVSERRGDGLLEVETSSEDDGWHVNLTLVVTLTVGHLIIFHRGSVQSKSCSRILLADRRLSEIFDGLFRCAHR